MTIDLKARGEKQPRESRAVGGLELRAKDGGDGNTLVGYACVTDSPYIMEDWLGDYTETVRAGAFTKTLAESADVRLLINHEGIALARTKSGTLRLTEVLDGKNDPQGKGQTGLWCEADLDQDSGLVRDMQSAMTRGDMDEMSFAFQVTKQSWSADYDYRTILECKLFDVSLVTYPANPATSANLRSLLRMQGVDPELARSVADALKMPARGYTIDAPAYQLSAEQRSLIRSAMEVLAGQRPSSAIPSERDSGYSLSLAKAQAAALL